MAALAARPAPGRERVVWRARVDDEVLRYDEHWQHLEAAERERALRFRIDADRQRFVVARSSLRQLLAARLGVASGSIVFTQNPFGKPALCDARPPLHFNTTHSGNWVMHAIDTAAPIGIDVEAVRESLADIDQFASVLSSEEIAFLNRVAAAQRAHAFAMTWVRKEAYVKAIGEGVSRELRDICIGADAGGRPRLLYDRNAGASLAGWHFEDLEVDARHVACVVYRSDVDEA